MNAESKLPINHLFSFQKGKEREKRKNKRQKYNKLRFETVFFSGSNGKKNKKNTPEVQFFTYLALCCHPLTHEINNKQNIMAKVTCPRR